MLGLNRAFGFFFTFSEIGEGRENRPQLRCGIASNQTHTARPNRAGKANRDSLPGEGEGRGRVALRAKILNPDI